jgi:hypothetical protein
VKSEETKVSRGMLNFINSYKPEKALVFNFKKIGIKKIKGTKMMFLPRFFI